MLNFRLEKAQPGHADELWRITRAAFAQEQHSQYIATGQAGYQKYLHDRLSQNYTDDARQLLVSSVEGRVAAFADITINDGQGNFLTRIAVSQDFRGYDIARSMMKRIQEVYQVENQWTLDVLSTNARARNLYKSLGFETVAQSKWLGRLFAPNNQEADPNVTTRDHHDIHYDRYGFTSIVLREHKFAIAGSAIRCYDIKPFLNNSLLNEVHELFPRTDRAFIILGAEDNAVDHVEDVFEIVRSERMKGSF